MRGFDSKSADLAPEFGIMAGRWAQYEGIGDMPFGAMWCVVPPGGRSNTDRHPERELVVVVQGGVDVQASGRTESAVAGGAVLLDGEEAHVLVNRSAEDPLVVLSLYWLAPGTDGAVTPSAVAEAADAD